MGKASATKQVERGGPLRYIRRAKERDRNENIFAWPNGPPENAEIAISCKGPGPARKKKYGCQYSRGGGRRCTDVPLWQSSRVELT